MSRIRLHVNVDHVATIRQARGEQYPDPVWAAAMCELAGAHGITVHLREDRRHIQDRDVRILKDTVRTVLNLEMAATDEMVRIARELHPDMCTLVPEKREEQTTEGGLVVTGPEAKKVGNAVSALHEAGIGVSLFVQPDRAVVSASRELGADVVELHTGYYSNARGPLIPAELDRLASAAEAAVNFGMRVAAGHGLDYPNVVQVAAIPGVEELNIGHSIIARSVLVGMDTAGRDMLRLLDEGAYGR